MTSRVRQGIVALTGLLAVAVVCAVAWPPRPGSEARAPAAPARAANAPAAPIGERPPSSVPARVRDLFEFADRAAEAPPTLLPQALVPPPLEPQPALASPLRLVGFVRRGDTLRAALSVTGDVIVLAVGEEADGYAVLAIDEDAGVTVRSPDGSEHLLPPPGP